MQEPLDELVETCEKAILSAVQVRLTLLPDERWEDMRIPISLRLAVYFTIYAFSKIVSFFLKVLEVPVRFGMSCPSFGLARDVLS